MLQVPPSQRLAYISAIIEEEEIRKPNAQFARETGADSGNISKMLKGDLPISDRFFTEVLKHHPNPPQKWLEEAQPIATGGLKRTLKDYVELLERKEKELAADKAFYQEILKTSLVSMNDKLTKLIEEKTFNSGSDSIVRHRKKPIVDPKALNPEIPAPPPRKEENLDDVERSNIREVGKKNRR